MKDVRKETEVPFLSHFGTTYTHCDFVYSRRRGAEQGSLTPEANPQNLVVALKPLALSVLYITLRMSFQYCGLMRITGAPVELHPDSTALGE